MAHGRTVTPSRPIWQNHYNIIHIILYWHPYFFREHQKLHWKKHKSSCCAYKVRIRHQLINKCNRRNKFCRSNIKTIALMIIRAPPPRPPPWSWPPPPRPPHGQNGCPRFVVLRTSAATWSPPETWSLGSWSSRRRPSSLDPRCVTLNTAIIITLYFNACLRLWQFLSALAATNPQMAGNHEKCQLVTRYRSRPKRWTFEHFWAWKIVCSCSNQMISA